MSGDGLVVVGVILGAHGVRGDVRVKSFTEEPEACFAYGALLSAEAAALVEAKSWRPAKDHFIVTPAHPKQKEEWDALKGALLHIPRAALPPTEDDELYVEDLIGLAAVAPDGAGLGTVKAVQDFGAGDLLEIAPAGGGASVLVPFTEAEAPDVDLAAGRIVIADFETWANQSKD
ncbi:MAG: ribosome maturation factor RimM [Pseudomonadota bacterium]